MQRLAEKETEALQGGGQERLDKLKSSGRLTARERLEYILDEGSFTELNMLAEHQCQEFGMADKKFTGDEATPLMPEEMEKALKELPRDPETVALFKKLNAAGPLPAR